MAGSSRGRARWGPLWREAAGMASRLAQKVWEDECPQRAASLAFTTLLSLVPFLAVAFAVLKGFGGLGAIQERVEGLLYTHLVTTSSWQAVEYIQRFTERANAGAIGTLGFLAFIGTAVSLLNTVAAAFNRVWGVADRRTAKDRFLTFFTLTILGPVLLGASISLTAGVRQAVAGAWLPLRGVALVAGLLLPFALTWAGFLLLYTVIPSAPLRLRPALFASLGAAGAWEAAKTAFEVYVTSVAAYGKLYASLGVIPIFLLWTYMSWLIALAGFALAFLLQHPRAAGGGSLAAHSSSPGVDAIRTFVAVAETFARGGGPATPAQLAGRLARPEESILGALAQLERQGLLARVAGRGEAYLPTRHPEAVRLGDLWDRLGGRMGAAEGDALERLLARAAEASARALGTITVQDLLDAGAPPTLDAPVGSASVDLTGPA